MQNAFLQHRVTKEEIAGARSDQLLLPSPLSSMQPTTLQHLTPVSSLSPLNLHLLYIYTSLSPRPLLTPTVEAEAEVFKLGPSKTTPLHHHAHALCPRDLQSHPRLVQ